MAQGGEASSDSLRKLGHMPIDYTGERRKRNRQQERLSPRDMEMLENVFMDAFAIPPEKMDFSYPLSIQNISQKLDDFPIDKLLGEMVKEYDLGISDIDSAITSEILNHDFRVFERPEEEDVEESMEDEELGAVGGEAVQIPKTRPLSSLFEKFAILTSNSFSTKARDFFGEQDCLTSLSLRVYGEAAPINIIVGEDDILDAGVVNEPYTKKHTYVEEDIRNDMRRFRRIKLSECFNQCNVRYHILYYWYHDLIKAGCVYWMAKDGENYILHDLTSTFKMTPYESSSQTAFDEIENRAIWNTFGLLYYYSVLYRWQNNIITPDLRDKAFELCKRATQMINNEDFPIEWCLANIIYSDICIPQNIDLNDTMLYIPTKRSNGTKEYKLKKVWLNSDSYKEMKNLLGDSLIHLKLSLDFLLNKLSTAGVIPHVSGNAPYGSQQFDFDLEKLAPDLIKVNVKEIRQISLIRLLERFVSLNDKTVRVTAYALRKLYVDFVLQARIFHKYDNFSRMAMLSEAALAAWVTMTSFLSENRMPLPLRPLYMLGDVCYKVANNSEKEEAVFKAYRKAKEQDIIRSLETISVTYDIDGALGLTKRDKQHFYMRDSFECFARAILYSEVVPDQDLLERICVVATDLVLSLLELSDENNDQYTGETNASRNLGHCKLLLDVVFNLVVQFIKERKLLVVAYVLKSKYLRICMHQELKRGVLVYKNINSLFAKIRKLLDKAFKVCDQLDKEKLIGQNLVTMERTVSLTDYIFRLRYGEEQNRVSYHKDIIPSYISYVDFCRSRFEDERHGLYFKFRAAVGYASLAEYLFGLYMEKKNDKIKDEAELWFEEAVVCFEQLHRFSVMEMIKTSNDRLAFYDFMTTGLKRKCVYDSKTIKLLLNSFELLGCISETEYKEYSSSELINNQRIRMRGVLKALEKRLLTAMNRRTRSATKFNNIIDIPRGRINELYLKSMNVERADLLQNLKSVLDEIRTLKNNGFRA